jgi:hypothetical protein
MSFYKRHFFLITRIAIFSILLSALVPSISHLVAAYNPEKSLPCHEILRLEVTNTQTNNAGHKSVSLLNDCNYCLMQADLPVIPSLPAIKDFFVLVRNFISTFFTYTNVSTGVWLNPLSRAPPLG